jgi:hypothetical protein
MVNVETDKPGFLLYLPAAGTLSTSIGIREMATVESF